MIHRACFFMLCTNETEKECLEKGLFGERRHRIQNLRTIKKGDIGFLFNISRNQLLGIFEAEDSPKLNIDPTAWGGEFPAQVKVKLISNKVERINDASSKLQSIIRFRRMKNKYVKIPFYNTYGPDITEKVLSLFNSYPMQTSKVADITELSELPEEYKLDNVAGLEPVKNFVYQRIIAPFEDEETAYSLKLKVGGGMLLVGPPGTGKTLISMSIARSIQAKFLDISPSVIIGYPGEAERRIENIFKSLNKEPRAVVFLDEAEWVLGKRDEQSSSVMQRVIPVLLSQLSKIFKERTRPIVVIAATNKPDKIDDAFLRPGRFDKIFCIGLPNKNTRIGILKLQLKDRNHNLTDYDIDDIAEKTNGYSGADLEYLIDESAYLSFSRRDEGKAIITKKDIEETIEKTSPSVSQDDLKELEEWRKKHKCIRCE